MLRLGLGQRVHDFEPSRNPAIARRSDTFAGRVAGSLLNSAGTPELVTRSFEEYEQLALALARDPDRLSALRSRLMETRNANSLFDLPKLAGHVETAYLRMWQNRLLGEEPASFSLESE